jgi:NAD(P)-dependent dehydrogenase (short-subunit alcohol dehydrogenase family)
VDILVDPPQGRAQARVHPHHHLGRHVEGRANLRRRIGEPEEIARVAASLVGDGSSHINGTVVADGGEPSPLPG